MDILGWDCSTSSDDDTEHIAADGEYDLWKLNCCIMQDAYDQSDSVLWDRVLAHWDKMLSH